MAQNTKYEKKGGFSLTESLISLLIVSLIIAMTMPAITIKKKTSGEGYWQTTNNSDIHYAMGSSTKVGIGTSTFNGTDNVKLSINTVAAGTIGQIIQRVAGQTANLLEFRDETGNPLTSCDASGTCNVGTNLQTGAIMYFYRPTCPTGWKAADGTSGTPDLRGEFIRGLDAGTGVDADHPRSLGSTQAESVKSPPPANESFGGAFQYFFVSTTRETINSIDGLLKAGINYSDPSLTPDSAVTRATIIQGSETRPDNVALLACIKE